jgi:hypothetical protein
MATKDDVTLWVSECCILDEHESAKAGDLYDSFASWIKSRGQHACSLRVWGERMSIFPGITSRRSNGVRYQGIRLSMEEKERMSNLRNGGRLF